LTCSASGELDLAPTSWVQMAGFNGPLLSLGCSKQPWTHNNIMTTGHYTVSFPTVEQTRCAGAIARTPRAERVAASGLTPV
ncbi:flavin reductase, partial [Klebsiella pneumoniae]|uniref:flavin reductase n=1 Tax=Klebsiella pneumoniae TaxID=573 RepID=UPI00391DAD24|nr:flavin reductase family protein [Klebsiella pneumoniae]